MSPTPVPLDAEPIDLYRRVAAAHFTDLRVDGDSLSPAAAKAACGDFSAKMTAEMQRIDHVLALVERLGARGRDLWMGAMSAHSIDEIGRRIAVRDEQTRRSGQTAPIPAYLGRLRQVHAAADLDELLVALKSDQNGSAARRRTEENLSTAKVPDLPMVDGVYRNLQPQQLSDLREDLTDIVRDLGRASEIFAEADAYGFQAVKLPNAEDDTPLEALRRLVAAAAEMRNDPQFRKAKLGTPADGLGPARGS